MSLSQWSIGRIVRTPRSIVLDSFHDHAVILFRFQRPWTGVLPSLPGNRVEPETPISQYTLYFSLLAILDGHPSTSLAQGVHTPGDRMITGIFNTIMRLASIEITDSSRFLLDALPCTKDTPLWAVRTALATSPPLSIFPIQFPSYSSYNA